MSWYAWLLCWFIASAFLAPFIGRLLARISEDYPEVDSNDESNGR